MMMRQDLGEAYGHGFEREIEVSGLLPRGEVLERMSQPVAGVHRLAKRLPVEKVAQALQNEPFEDYSRVVWAWKELCSEGGEAKERLNRSSSQGASLFLRRAFHGLTFVPGISFDLDNISEEREIEAVGTACDVVVRREVCTSPCVESSCSMWMWDCRGKV